MNTQPLSAQDAAIEVSKAITDIDHQLTQVRASLEFACKTAGRAPDEVTLIAVSKTRSADEIRVAARAQQRHFGENYLQEALEKMSALADESLVWHFIGPIQSNKTRDIAAGFDWVHSVDREKIARRLSDQRPTDKPPLQVCIQVNISGESSKSGVSPEAAIKLAEAIMAMPNLTLRGLMAIPAPDTDDPAAPFAALKSLLTRIQANASQPDSLDCLSMGMSDDYPQAIAEGATMVRIGTAIFGPRH